MRKPITLQDLHNARIHDAGNVARHALAIIQELEAENARLRIANEALEAHVRDLEEQIKADVKDCLAAYEKNNDLQSRVHTLEAENERLRTQVKVLGDQVCQFHDTNPLNETVVELEAERDEAVRELHWRRLQSGAIKQLVKDAGDIVKTGVNLENQVANLEAENRVVRELVEDALDVLWSANRKAYDGILARCTWMMGEEHRQPIDLEHCLEATGITIRVRGLASDEWHVVYNRNDHWIEIAQFTNRDDAERTARAIHESATRAVLFAVDPLLARIAALTREYQDYMTIADHCTAVYSHFSGGRISKPFTLPSEVIAQAEEIQNKDFQEWLEVELEPIKARLLEWVELWWRVPAVPAKACNDLAIWIEETFYEGPNV